MYTQKVDKPIITKGRRRKSRYNRADEGNDCSIKLRDKEIKIEENWSF